MCIAAACLFLAGCQNAARVETPEAMPPVVVESDHVDPESGNLIAWWMTRREGTPKGELVPVLATHPYAIFIQWPSEEYCPDSADKRIFLFYDNVKKKSYQTRDFEAFLKVVAAQPRDIRLRQFDTCTQSRAYVPKEPWDRLEKVLAAGNRTWATNPVTENRIIRVCYCECDWDFVFPGDKH
jgi:hypothetical protein